MADTVRVVVKLDLPAQKRRIYHFTSLSDGTGESAVQKIDISGLPGAPTYVRICKIWGCISGMVVVIYFDHTTDDVAELLNDSLTCNDYDSTVGGLVDPKSAGGTGDILFSTFGHSANDSYSIFMEIAY